MQNKINKNKYINKSPTGFEHSNEEIYGCHSRNAKLFEWIEHSGIRQGKM